MTLYALSLYTAKSNWYLYGVSAAARRKPCIQLKIGDNTVGKSAADNSIVIPSNYCSRHHCNLVVNEYEVILRDSVSDTSQYFFRGAVLCCDDDVFARSDAVICTTRSEFTTVILTYLLEIAA